MNSEDNLKKIADFLKDQESQIENPDKTHRKSENNEEALNQINKFLEEQSRLEEKKENYDPEAYPPDIEFALKHAKANKVATPYIENQNKNVEVCKCCGLPIENDELLICADRADFSFLGPGFPLYFELMIFSLFVLLLMILILGIYGMVKNFYQDDCYNYSDLQCSFTNITLLSMVNKSKSSHLLTEQAWVNLACLLTIIVVTHVYRRRQNLTEKESLRGLTTPANYTIMMSNIPKGIYNDNDIKQLLISNWNKRSGLPELRIKKVVQSYFIGDYVNLVISKNALLNDKKKYLRYRKKNGNFPSNINIEEINTKINELTAKIQESANILSTNLKKTCGTVFVTFDTIGLAHSFIKRYHFGFYSKLGYYFKKFCCFQKDHDNIIELDNQILAFEEAKDPNDILWENLGYSQKEKLKKRIATLMASFLLLAFCFALILLISYGKTRITNNYQEDSSIGTQSGIRVLSAASSLSIVFLNSCLIIFVKKFALYEKHASTTHFNLSIARTLSLAQFVNTAIIMLLVHYFLSSKLGESDGLVFDMFNVFLANSIITPLMNIFDVFYILKLFKRRQIKKESVKSLYTQAETNSVFEGMNLDMWRKYPILIKTMWMTAFYASLTPIGIPISMFALLISYWVDKYLIIKRYKRPLIISADLNKEMTDLFEMVPLFMAAGSMIFNEILWQNTRELSERMPDILGLAISFGNYVIPSDKIHKFFWRSDSDIVSEIEYDNMRKNFLFEYDRCNPITQEKALNEWIEFIKKNGEIVQKYKFEGETNNKNEQNFAYLNNYAEKTLLKRLSLQKINYGFNLKDEITNREIKNLEMNKICMKSNKG